MFELFRHLYWEAGKPTVAAESHFQWERGDAGEFEGQVGRITNVKNCWYNPQVWAKQWVSCPWVWHIYVRFWTSMNMTSTVCSWPERGSISTHWNTSGSEERAPESMESTDQSAEVEKEPEKVEEQETTTEWTFLQLVRKICWDITTTKLTFLQKIFGISQPCSSWSYMCNLNIWRKQ